MNTDSINSFDSIFNLVGEATKLENKGTLAEKGLKLTEEVGELAAEILKITGYKHTKDTVEQAIQNSLLESVDSLIMIFLILHELGFSKEDRSVNVRCIGYVASERITKVKKDCIVNKDVLNYVLEQANIKVEEIDQEPPIFGDQVTSAELHPLIKSSTRFEHLITGASDNYRKRREEIAFAAYGKETVINKR